MVNAVQAYAWTANGASRQYSFVTRSPICFNAAEGEKVPRRHICLNSQMFKHVSSLATLNSIYSLIKLCLIDVVDIPLESHVLYQHFYFNSLCSTKISEYPFMHKGTAQFQQAKEKKMLKLML